METKAKLIKFSEKTWQEIKDYKDFMKRSGVKLTNQEAVGSLINKGYETLGWKTSEVKPTVDEEELNTHQEIEP